MLDEMAEWSDEHVIVRSRAHLSTANPLRRGERLDAICGVEFGLQAAALHGALRSGFRAQSKGVVASLRGVELLVDFLDEPGFGTIEVEAILEHADAAGMVYTFRLATNLGSDLVRGRGIVLFPAERVPFG